MECLTAWLCSPLAWLLILVAAVVWLGVYYDRREQKKHWKVATEEEVPSSDSQTVFENLPNFRQAGGCGLVTEDGRRVRDGLLYRSSRTDFLTSTEMTKFGQFNINAIFDLRRIEEYHKADGAKLLDDQYKVCVVKNGQVQDFRQRGQKTAQSAESYRGKRYLINMVSLDHIWNVVMQVNFVVRYLSLVLLLVDWLFSVHLFVRFYNWLVVNKQTMSQQYVDVLEFNKPAVASILRLLISNTPVLIHCAHGKDRTGVVIAMILGCLGVRDEDIAQDYCMSESGLAPMRQRLYSETVGRYGFREEFAGAQAHVMREAMSEIKTRYGSVSGYLESAGFSTAEQEDLKTVFLD